MSPLFALGIRLDWPNFGTLWPVQQHDLTFEPPPRSLRADASSNMTSSGTLASTDWSDTRFSGETDGYPSLNMKKLNEGNKAMYLLMKGSAQTGDGSSEWAMGED